MTRVTVWNVLKQSKAVEELVIFGLQSSPVPVPMGRVFNLPRLKFFRLDGDIGLKEVNSWSISAPILEKIKIFDVQNEEDLAILIGLIHRSACQLLSVEIWYLGEEVSRTLLESFLSTLPSLTSLAVESLSHALLPVFLQLLARPNKYNVDSTLPELCPLLQSIHMDTRYAIEELDSTSFANLTDFVKRRQPLGLEKVKMSQEDKGMAKRLMENFDITFVF